WSPLDLALQIAPWGSKHHQAFDERINHEISLYLCGEDLPEESNRVELDWGHLDGFGMPGVVTHHELNENSRRLGRDMIAHAHQVLEAAGGTRSQMCRPHLGEPARLRQRPLLADSIAIRPGTDPLESGACCKHVDVLLTAPDDLHPHRQASGEARGNRC